MLKIYFKKSAFFYYNFINMIVIFHFNLPDPLSRFPQGGKALPAPSPMWKNFRRSCLLLPLWGKVGKGVKHSRRNWTNHFLSILLSSIDLTPLPFR